MNARSTPVRTRICVGSIAALVTVLLPTPSPGNSYSVPLGDSLVVPGLVTGATGLTKTGGGTLVLTNPANNYTGTTTISNGSVVITSPSALGTDSSAVVVTGFNPSSGATNLRGFGGGSLVLNGTGAGMLFTRDLQLQGQGPIADRGAALISLGTNTIAGALNLNSPFAGTNVPTSLFSVAGTMHITGPVNVQGPVGLSAPANFGFAQQAGVSNYRLTGPLSGTGTIQKMGAGVLALSPSSSTEFSGTFRTNVGLGQSSIRITNADVLGTRTSTGAQSVIELGGGLLEILMDSPSLNTGTTAASLYSSASSTLFVDRAPGSNVSRQTLALGRLSFAANVANFTTTFAGRNGYNIDVQSPAAVINNNPVTFTNNLQGGTLGFSGPFWNITDNTGNRLFSLVSNSSTVINGGIVASAASFDHSFTKTGTGTLTVNGTNTTLDGTFTIGGGTVATRRIVGGLIGDAPNSTVQIGSGTNPGTLDYLGAIGSGAGETVTRNIALGFGTATARINANQTGSAATPLVISGPFVVNTSSKTLILGGTSGLANAIASSIIQPSPSVLSLQKSGPGRWVLSTFNDFSGNTTITQGTLEARANGASSDILPNASTIVFTADNITQSAGGRLQLIGWGGIGTEVAGTLTPQQGHATVGVNSQGASTTLSFPGLASNTATLGASVNFEAPTVLDVVSIAGTAGFVRGSVYWNGANFAYTGSGGILRAPNYGSDAGFVNRAAAPLSGFAHNQVTGSFSELGGTITSLKIAGSHTLTLNGGLNVNNGFGTLGGVLVDGGNAVIQDGGGGSITQGLGPIITGGAPLVFRVNQESDSLQLAVPISNTSTQGFAKNGRGTLILASFNNQTGATHINEGSVVLQPGSRLSAPLQSLVIRQDATLDLNGVTQGADIVAAFSGAGRVTNSSTAAAEFTFGANNGGGTFSGIIEDGASRVSVTKTGTAGATLSGLNTFTGTLRIGSTGLVTVTDIGPIGTPGNLGQGDASSPGANAGSLIFTGAQVGTTLPGGLAYTGTAHSETDRLFRLGGSAAGAGARIQASGANNAALVFTNPAPIGYEGAGADVPQTLVLSGNSSGDNRMGLQLVNSGAVGGSLGVTKADAGKWILSNPGNSYTGNTLIQSGTLEAIDGGSLPTASPLVFTATVGNPGVLETSGLFVRPVSATPAPGSVSFLSTATASGSGGFSAAGEKLTVNLGGASAPLTWGAGGFLMDGGTVATTLRLNSPTAKGEVEFQNPISFGTGLRTVQVDDNGNNGGDFATLSGVLSGAGGFRKTGGGILSLLGANTYQGPTEIASGTLTVRSLGLSAAPGATSVGSSALGNTDAGAVTFSGTSILQYVGPGETTDRKIRLASGAVTALQIHADGSGPLLLTNVEADGSTVAKTLALRGTSAAGNRIDGVLQDGGAALALTVDGAATWILTNPANSYTGTTTVNAGALGIGNDSALGFGNLALGNGNLFAYGADRVISNTVRLNDNSNTGIIGDHSITLANPLAAFTGAFGATLTNNLVAGEAFTSPGITANQLTANRLLTVDGNGVTVISGSITSTTAFGLGLVKTGYGTLVLSGSNSDFTKNGGNLEIDNGTVRAGATNVIPVQPGGGGVVFTPDNATEVATLNLNGFSQSIGRLLATGTAASVIDNASAAPVTLSVGGTDGAVNFNGSILASGGGAISLLKAGTAAGTLSGPVSGLGGTLTVAGGSLAFTSSDPANVQNIAVQGGTALRLDNGIGTNFAGLNTLQIGSIGQTTQLGLDIGTVSDRLAIPGTASVAGQVNFSISATAGFGAGTYTLLSAAGGLSGATYGLNGFVPGGFTYSLASSPTAVQLLSTEAAPGTKFWRGDLNGSWSGYASGNTNWEDPGGSDPSSTPGPLDVVVFSSTLNLPGSTFVTTLDASVVIEALAFNGATSQGFAGARVGIAPGQGGTLTISPATPVDGIEVPDNGGVASISAPVILAADQSWTVGSIGFLRPELIVSGPMSGTGNLTKRGDGTASLTGASTRTGRTIIDGGTLRIPSEAALGANPATFTPDHLVIGGSSTSTLRNISTLTIDDPNRGITLAGPSATIDTLGGNITIGVNNIISGAGALRKDSGNTLILLGANTYTGGTIINGGAIRAGHSSALGTGAVNLVNTGTVLELADGVSLANAVTISDGGNDKAIRLLPGANAAEVVGSITQNEQGLGNFRLQASGTGVLTIAGAIVGPSSTSTALRINEVAGNTGTVVLAGANSFPGGTEIRQGTLRNGANEVIPSTIVVNASQSASPTATYDTGVHNETVTGITFGASGSSNAPFLNTVTTGTGILTLAGNVTTVAGHPMARAALQGNLRLSGLRSITVADALSEQLDLLLAATIDGAGGLIKAGPGTLAVTGNGTYTGGTQVNAGTLLVNGSIGGAVSVAGGTLAGTGSVGGLNASSGSIAPGASIGTLSSASLTMSGSAAFSLEINTTTLETDLLQSSGPVSLSLVGSPLVITDLGGGGGLPEGTTFRFLTYSGGFSGRFSIGGNPIDDDIEYFSIGANQFLINYDDLAGTAVSLVVVPEPGVVPTITGGLALLAGLSRLRSRRFSRSRS